MSGGFFIFFFTIIWNLALGSHFNNNLFGINLEAFSVKNLIQLKQKMQSISSKINDYEQIILKDIRNMDKEINTELNKCNEIRRLYERGGIILDNYCLDPRKIELIRFKKESNSCAMIEKTEKAIIPTVNFLQLHKELDTKIAKLEQLRRKRNQIKKATEFFQNESGGDSFEPSLLSN
jgi:hypothetical protein